MPQKPDYLIKVEIPALDRFCDLIEKRDQAGIDQLTEQVKGLRAVVTSQTSRLQAEIDSNAR